MATSDSEKDLVLRLSKGEETAFNQVYLAYSATVYNTAIIYVKDLYHAQEIVQQTFIRLWENRHRLAAVENFRNYLLVMARNLIYDQLKAAASETRQRKVFREIQLSEDLHIEAPSAGPGSRYEALWQSAIKQLPAQQRQVYLKIEEDKLSYEEVAKDLGLSRLTVKKHLELARKFIKMYVNSHLHSTVSIPLFLLFLYTAPTA